mmetsp:Transcript_36213/g.94192  ORF Transcript_36213/g.94192 Transcript_36213/m.94192 type:complete len:239 (-) Transcript_36213:1121-1837(-)
MPLCRVAAAGLVRFFDGEGRLFLLRNIAYAKKGTTVYSPLGGGIQLTTDGIDRFQNEFKAKEFQSGNDLRVRVDSAQIPAIAEWFQLRAERGVDPWREIVEELVEEEGVLTEEEVMEGVKNVQFRGYRWNAFISDRPGVEGQPSLRLLEVFSAEITPTMLSRLQQLTKPSTEVRRTPFDDPLVYFATKEEVEKCETTSGFGINKVTKQLLDEDVFSLPSGKHLQAVAEEMIAQAEEEA